MDRRGASRLSRIPFADARERASRQAGPRARCRLATVNSVSFTKTRKNYNRSSLST